MVFEDSQIEYRYVSEQAAIVQKLLNQWRHEYVIWIIACEFENCTLSTPPTKYVNLLLARRRKDA